MATVKEGDKVTWNYSRGKGEGTVSQVSEKNIRKTIKGKQIKRKGSAEEPAMVIKQDDGGSVVKSASEVKKQ